MKKNINKIKREFSAGGIVFRKEPEGVLWLVVKPTGDNRWRFPKGKIEGKESSGEAAQREVREEAGIETTVLGKVDNEKFFFVWDGQKIFKTVTFYLMEYLQESRENYTWETEMIDWLPFEEARQRIAFDKEKELLNKAQQQLENSLKLE
jgi:8-oxo-dGTP pyrophosphatase MutT (NUDIX family)